MTNRDVVFPSTPPVLTMNYDVREWVGTGRMNRAMNQRGIQEQVGNLHQHVQGNFRPLQPDDSAATATLETPMRKQENREGHGNDPSTSLQRGVK